MAQYSIKDLERLSGIKAHTIRIWEQRYGVLKPERTETNIRRYDDMELKLLLNISQLIRHGGKISKLSRLTEDQLSKELEVVSENTSSPDDFYSIHIDKLIIAMVDFCERKFEKVISVTTIKFGFDATMRYVILPFLRKVGIMWQVGEINVAQEHFVTNLIRRKIIVAIDGLLIPERDVRYVLYLPEGEFHEMGLLFAKYYFKSRGVQVLYLGQSVPLKDLKEAIKVYDPKGWFTFITTPTSSKVISHYFESLKNDFPQVKMMVAGPQVLNQLTNPVKEVNYFYQIDEFVSFLDKNNHLN
ncbi:MAG: MerR family transcriptional regulator [Sphingobacteriales bacterium JAD_PAG50586_3]|nr:MAG: MerR family transcriptional regulator [Sphingobacteriales bacterium JAD_PAG50586_3]